MADNDDVLFSPQQEEWIKELASSLHNRRDPSPPATTTVGTSLGIESSPDNMSSAGNLCELAIFYSTRTIGRQSCRRQYLFRSTSGHCSTDVHLRFISYF